MGVTRLQGVKAVRSTVQFLFNFSHGKIILKQADHLSETLQNPSISAAQGQEIGHVVIEMLWKDTCDEKFELFWYNLMNKKTDVAGAMLQRRRKLPDFYHFQSSKVFTMITQKNLSSVVFWNLW